MPKVINIRDTGYKVPEGAVYVGRANSRYHFSASKWGNPMTVREIHALRPGLSKEEAYQVAVNWYIKYLAVNPELFKAIHELEGKDLACYCAPLPCHADILLKLANDG